MNVRKCDKCKKEIIESPMQAVSFPIVYVEVLKNYACAIYTNGNDKVDLCPKCQHEVYNFIFGEAKK